MLPSEALALRLGARARLCDMTCIFDMYCGAMHCSHVRATEQGCAVGKENHSWARRHGPFFGRRSAMGGGAAMPTGCYPLPRAHSDAAGGFGSL